MKAIVCGTDFSEPARQAARVAAALAGQLQCSLILVHVDDALPARDGAPDSSGKMLQERRDSLEQQARELRALTTAPIETTLVYGSISERVILEAGRFGAGLIVVASLGRGMGRGWLLGGNAERIAQHSRVPVLVVRQPEPLLKWIHGESALQAIVCADMTHASRAALRWARGLRSVGPAKLELAYVAWPPAEQPNLTSPGSGPLDPPWTALEASLVDDLKLWAAGTSEDAAQESCRVLVNWGRTDAAIALHAATSNSALIVAGTHRRSHVARLWHGSVSRALLHHADTNVACVPPGRDVAAGDAVVVKRVLAAVDMSDTDVEVVRTALGLAPRLGEVHVLHVLDARASPEVEQEALRRLSTLLGRIQQHSRVATQLTVRRGESVHAAIVEQAELTAADAICIGMKRRSRTADFLLGSQTHGVLKLARVPVILVPASEEVDSAT
jgi:nucleotide-binding universal stress UspA family protein